MNSLDGNLVDESAQPGWDLTGCQGVLPYIMNKNSGSFDKFSRLRGKVCSEIGLERRPYLDRVFMSVAGERGEFAKLAKEWLAGWDSVNLNRTEGISHNAGDTVKFTEHVAGAAMVTRIAFFKA
jgi:hypothetical protein